MPCWWMHSEGRGERLRVEKDRHTQRERQSDLISEHIAHIVLIGAVKYSHSWNWRLRRSQLVGGVSICVPTVGHIAALTLGLHRNKKRKAR